MAAPAQVWHTAGEPGAGRGIVVHAELREVLEPLLQEVESLNERIQEYEVRMEKIAKESYPHVEVLKQVKGVGTQIGLTYVLAGHAGRPASVPEESRGRLDPDHCHRRAGARHRRLAAVRPAAPRAPPSTRPGPRPRSGLPAATASGGGGAETAGTAAAPETPAAATGVLEVERPPPSAGRLVRLRARLARSQSWWVRRC